MMLPLLQTTSKACLRHFVLPVLPSTSLDPPNAHRSMKIVLYRHHLPQM